jgi:hypothetical protein
VLAAAIMAITSCAVFAGGAGVAAASRADDTPPPAPTVHTVTSIADYPGDGVTPPAPGTWYANDSRTAVGDQVGIVGSPSDPTNIDGSLKLDTETGSDKANIAYTAPDGTKLSSLTALSYDTMRDPTSTNANPLAVGSLQLSFSCAGDGTFNGSLNFEPTYQDPNTVTPGQWETWDAYKDGNAVWWSSWYIPKDPDSGLVAKKALGPDDNADDYYTAFNDFIPLSAFEAACPDATVLQFVINQGSGQNGLLSYADNVRINDDVWDFAVTGQPTLTVDLPTLLSAGQTSAPFDGTVAVPDDGPQVLNRRLDFVIVPTDNMGSLSPSDVTLEYKTGPDAWEAVPLTVVHNPGHADVLYGEFGPHDGVPTPLEPGATATNTFRVTLADNVKGGVLGTIVGLVSVNPTSGAVVKQLATTGGQTAVVGPKSCPAFIGNSAVVRLGYLRMLNRCPDTQGLAFWTTFLDSGHSQAEFGVRLAASAERFTNLITRSYEAVFDRAPDPGGLQFWQQYFQNGGRFDSFIAMLAASSETANAHPGAQALVEAMYHIVLNRAGDPQGIAFWTNKVQNGTSPASLAAQLAYSSEFATDVVGSTPTQLASFGPGIYQEILGRGPDSGGLVFWATYFHDTGVTYYLEGLMAGSQEFYNQAQTFPES